MLDGRGSGYQQKHFDPLRAEYAQSKELAFPGHGKQKLSPMEEENRRLRKELAELKEERDILKKATAIFSRKPK